MDRRKNSNNRFSPKPTGVKGPSRTAGQINMNTETGMDLKLFSPGLLHFVFAGKFKHLYKLKALQHYHNPQAYAAHRQNSPIPMSSQTC